MLSTLELEDLMLVLQCASVKSQESLIFTLSGILILLIVCFLNRMNTIVLLHWKKM